MDKKCVEVLGVLKRLNTNGSYKVITVDEISAEIKGLSATSVKQSMDTLAREGYINIKFSEDNTYCYSIIKKQADKDEPAVKQVNNKLFYLFAFLASFGGSFIAFLLVVLIF